jgi:hypothetical protein
LHPGFIVSPPVVHVLDLDGHIALGGDRQSRPALNAIQERLHVTVLSSERAFEDDLGHNVHDALPVRKPVTVELGLLQKLANASSHGLTFRSP